MKNTKILLALLLIFTLFLFSGCGDVNQGMPDTNDGITNDGVNNDGINNNGTDNGTRDGNDNGMGTDRDILDDNNLTDGGIRDNTNQ